MIFDLIFVEYQRKVEMACCELSLLYWVWSWDGVNSTPGFGCCWAGLAQHQLCLSTFPHLKGLEVGKILGEQRTSYLAASSCVGH